MNRKLSFLASCFISISLAELSSADLLLFQQDPNQSVANQWILNRYDDYGQLVLSGFYNKGTISTSDISTPQDQYFQFQCFKEYGSEGIEKGKLIIEFNGLTKHYKYDNMGRISAIQRGDESDRLCTVFYSYSGGLSGSILAASNVVSSQLCEDVAFQPTTAPDYRYYPLTDAVSFKYDSYDNLTKKKIPTYFYPFSSYAECIWDYDKAGRLINEQIIIDEGRAYVIEGIDWDLQNMGVSSYFLNENLYTSKGELKSLKLGRTSSNPLQTVDYQYLPNGYLELINNPNSLGGDYFGLSLGYEVPSASPHHGNGNIYTSVSNMNNSGGKRIASYNYDYLDRIKSYNDGRQANSTYTYRDARGNFASLSRSLSGTITFDNLSYSYVDNLKSNKILSIVDSPVSDEDFGYVKSAEGSYQYDANGNITFDPANNVIITYNHLNLPIQIRKANDLSSVIDYNYTFDGELIDKTFIESGNLIGKRKYWENIEIYNDQIDIIHHDNGYLKRGTYCNTINNINLTGMQSIDETIKAKSISSSRFTTNNNNVLYYVKDRGTLQEGFSTGTGGKFSIRIEDLNHSI